MGTTGKFLLASGLVILTGPFSFPSMAQSGYVDVEAERARMEKELDKVRKDAARIANKLGNESFVAKAPEAVVAKERQKQAELSSKADALEAQLSALDDLSS